MLDRAKVAKQLEAVSNKLFSDRSLDFSFLQEVWDAIVKDQTFAAKIDTLSLPWVVPEWHGLLDDARSILKSESNYQVLSIDGSQIYPDRHQGGGCFLINIGSIGITYGLYDAVSCNTEPYIFTHEDLPTDFYASQDFVNCYRQELEFSCGYEQFQQLYDKNNSTQSVLLFDGSLIFWHLISKDSVLKERFFNRYIKLLDQFYKDDAVIAGYISFPKTKELVVLIRVALFLQGHEEDTITQMVQHVTDATIVQWFLQPGQRTTIFKSGNPLCAQYPSYLQPHFCYVHVGQEIARVEFPAWVAESTDRVDRLLSIVLDQCVKGQGYPIICAEAHEQAVVKGADREFFYHLLTQLSVQQKHAMISSAKSLKKRFVGY